MSDTVANRGRRRLLIGATIGGAALAAPWLRPGDKGGAHNEYFLRLQEALREAGLYRPTLVLDQQRFDANINTLNQHLPSGFGYRIVGKSLPSLPLIEKVRKATGTDRVMVFHQPFLNLVAREMPDAQVLMGKPMPVAAAERFYLEHRHNSFSPSTQIQWLIDSPLRLRQYSELAIKLKQNMLLNFELDVGLHRGGYTDPATIAQSIAEIRQQPLLQFSGFMGYEAHASKMPAIVGGPEAALAKAMDQYSAAVDAAKSVLGDSFYPEQLTLNAGGSSTYQMYDSSAPCNELAMGSGLIKPTDFDVKYLSNHMPAAFIATPVIKALDSTQLPGMESLTGVMSTLNPNTARTFFSYGGYWKAQPESPPGLKNNTIFGHSTNQEMWNGSRSMQLAQDDFIFLRPSQSEFVFLQFGDIAVFDGQHITEQWSVFSEGA
ncbi:MAG: DSD1 family PLP-dependent enzyme [Spongiibacteraceae bacterium]